MFSVLISCVTVCGNMSALSLQKPQLPLLGSCSCSKEGLNPHLA